MVISHSYVSLPEGNLQCWSWQWLSCFLWIKTRHNSYSCSHPMPSVRGNLPYVLILVGRQTRLYIYIYTYMCVNILAHIHIILHKLWVSKYPVYIYWVASKYQNLDPQNPSKSNDLVVYSTMAMGQHGHGARHKARLPCQAKLRRKSQGCASWSDWLVRIECSAGFCNCGYKSSNQWCSTGL